MRAVVQRVTVARVMVGGLVVGQIENGILVFAGIGREDGLSDVEYIAEKILDLRIFEDDQGKMNRSVVEVNGSMLVVSQFTLYGDCRKGRRPSFNEAASPTLGRTLYDELLILFRSTGLTVQTGEFQSMMQVELTNDGPVTLLIDSKRAF